MEVREQNGFGGTGEAANGYIKYRVCFQITKFGITSTDSHLNAWSHKL
ncbi:MAG: hypothetical protein OXD32_07260 [Endozoicomonadaceae bacterium]|nr:hypothetical protein [Endozoicomonadaceae bacterium]MCY4330215.1 hypothetical protein [Endozoicomonadaceae bacterium]